MREWNWESSVINCHCAHVIFCYISDNLQAVIFEENEITLSEAKSIPWKYTLMFREIRNWPFCLYRINTSGFTYLEHI